MQVAPFTKEHVASKGELDPVPDIIMPQAWGAVGGAFDLDDEEPRPIASSSSLPVVHISLPIYRACWVAVMAMHALAAAVFAAMAKLHVYIESSEQVAFAMDFLGDRLVRFFDAVVVVSGSIAVLHAASFVYALGWSLRSRALVFGRPASASASTAPAPRSEGETEAATSASSKLRCCLTAAYTRVVSTWTKFKRTVERSGVQLAQLELMLELALQTFQANKLSTLVTTVWVNRVMAFALVANCWFSPLVHWRMQRHSMPAVRVVHFLVDAALDVVYAMVLPVAVFYPYVLAFDAPSKSFPLIYYYMDAWYINAVAENRQLFVTSWTDFAAKMLPGATLVVRLLSVRALLARSPLAAGGAIKLAREPMSRKLLTFRSHSRRVRVRSGVHVVLVLWGLAVLGLHLHATGVALHGHDSGCLMEMRPWAATRYTCVALEVSCSQRRIQGARDELDAAFARVRASAVQGLVVSHCPALVMPPRLQTFTGLQLLKLHNSTIAEWDDDAALTGAAHPELQLVYMTLTDMARLPAGLLALDFPPNLYDIEICGTNLTVLPAELAARWSAVPYVLLERSPDLKAIPPVLAEMSGTDWISLAGNALTFVPERFFESRAMFSLLLASNPIAHLPDVLGPMDALYMIDIRDTLVAALPRAWLREDHASSSSGLGASASGTGSASATEGESESESESASPIIVRAGGTPLCAKLAPALESTLGRFSVQCKPLTRPADGGPLTIYPLEQEMQWRLANKE